jgi:formylmethanofuran dehydrogenase subunit E
MIKKKINIGLFDEEWNSLSEGKEICVFEDEDKGLEIYIKRLIKVIPKERKPKVLCDTCGEWVEVKEYNINSGLCNKCVEKIQ